MHRGLELLDIDEYTAIREYQNNAMKKGFPYDEQKDAFICRKGKYLQFQKLIYKKSSQNYYRLYIHPRKQCKECPMFSACVADLGIVRINASAYYPSFIGIIRR